MNKILNWLDKHILKASLIFLIIFIPLYPKFPLLDLKHTWVYVRIDDLVIALVTVIFGIQLLRRKATLHTPLTIPIVGYWLAGLATTIFALIFIVGQLPQAFPGLVILHYLRRIEYMIVFFIAVNSVRSTDDLKHFFSALGFTVLVVGIYAIGQRLAGLPAVLTMNEEFAKGKLLYLPPAARISSTFAGHYDLAAYMVLVIPLIISVMFAFKRKSLRLALFLLGLFAYIILLFTESRISIGAYLLASSLGLWLIKKRRLILPVLIINLALMSVFSGSSERFYKTFRIREVAFNLETGRPVAAIKKIEEKSGTAIAESQEITKEELPVGTGFIGLPVGRNSSGAAGGASLLPRREKAGKVGRKTKRKNIAVRQLQFKTYATQELAATGEAKIATVSGKFLIRKALVYDISFTTRFQGEWPRAVAAFKRNPILGSGFSTLSLAVDNDYLRMLGESGVLGSLAFLLIFFAFGAYVYRAQKAVKKQFSNYFAYGVLAGSLGLAANAVFIDVFEASKVAYTLWIMLGLAVGGIYLVYPKNIAYRRELIAFFTSPALLIIELALFAAIFFHPLLDNYFVGDDYTWLRWAAESSVKDVLLFFIKAGGFFYRPLQKILYLIMFNFFWLLPRGYHLVGLAVHIGIAAGVFALTLRLTQRRWQALASALIFIFLASDSESLFWISSLGNQLGTLFTVWALYFYVDLDYQRRIRFVPLFLSFFASMSAMLAYEGGIVAPLIILFYESLRQQRRLKLAGFFVLQLPLYLGLRAFAGAHGLAGDYSYNYWKLPANALGNLLGYLMLFVAGPRAVEPWLAKLRFIGRNNVPLFVAVALLAAISFGVFAYLVFRKKQFSITAKLMSGYMVIALLPFVGLGNISIRYSLAAAPGFAGLAAGGLAWIYTRIKRSKKRFAAIVAAVILGIFVGYNMRNLRAASKDWRIAGQVAQQAILALKQKYFPLEAEETNFFFVNVPIRYGLAWIFPVGLEDALWHTFRDPRLKVYQVSSVGEAFKMADKQSNAHVFLFKQNKLEEVSMATVQFEKEFLIAE